MKHKPDVQAHGCIACRACFIEHCTICYYCIEPDIELTKIARAESTSHHVNLKHMLAFNCSKCGHFYRDSYAECTSHVFVCERCYLQRDLKLNDNVPPFIKNRPEY